jgi:hypothetical protein
MTEPRINTAGPRQATPEQLDCLTDILLDTERIDKITIDFNLDTRTVTLIYEDLDDEWFNDLWRLGQE